MNPPLHHFAEIYCEQHGLLPEKFTAHIRSRTLYPHARLIVPFLLLFNSDYLSADNDFIQDVGWLSRYRDFSNSSFEYIHHPANRGFLRRALRLRVSTERMRKLVRKTLSSQSDAPVETQETIPPSGAGSQSS